MAAFKLGFLDNRIVNHHLKIFLDTILLFILKYGIFNIEAGRELSGFLIVYSALPGPNKSPASFSFSTLNPFNGNALPFISISFLLVYSIFLTLLKNSACLLSPVNLAP